ncbi:MAG: SOS response-associated peptidase [Arachnia sp.]
MTTVGAMCGRYAATADPDELMEEYRIEVLTDEGAAACVPNYNVAPTDLVPVIRERVIDDRSVRGLDGFRWGLVPSWSKDASGAARLINARSETLATKASFRSALRARRCLLPALGYYEWKPQTEGGRSLKQPYFLQPSGHSRLMIAGIYEFWRGSAGWLSTVSIITCQASDEVGWVHDRMPMTVLDNDRWLDPRLTDSAAALSLLSAPNMRAHPVSRAVGNVANNGPELLEPTGE